MLSARKIMLPVSADTSWTGAGSTCLRQLPTPLIVQPVAVTATSTERKWKLILLPLLPPLHEAMSSSWGICH
ncbi:hypothetical protein HAX54_005397 [Datura stramonium]|uniref:Uncharacterized protein n=1 Tax=Datura stramonium TaxID=4076 RepID=A0ABS8TA43_DATST|nr:hypothetical protein [Datura stramonium]